MSEDLGGNTPAASPSTFAEAFAADASPASDPSQQTTTPAAAEQPTTASEPTAPVGDDRSPFIPRERFDTVNKRMQDAESWKAQYAWAEQVDRATVEQAVQLAQLYSTDRAGYIRTLLSEAINDPQLAPAIRSEAARLLGTRGPTAPEAPQMVPVQLEDGTVVNMPRDPQAWLAYERQKWQAELDEKFAPALQTAEQLKAAQAQYQKAQEAQQFAATFGSDLAKRPHFDELKTEIVDRLGRAQLASDHPAEVRAAALAIYADLVSEKVLPQRDSKAQSDLLDSLQRKAAASTSVNPGSAAPSTPKTYSSFAQLGPEAWK